MIRRWALCAIVVATIVAPAHANPPDTRSSSACRRCHSDIFRLWNGSLHGQSYTNSSFQATYLTARTDVGDDAARHCLRCHAPLAHLADDLDPSSPAAAEGVTCTYCHSIAAVRGGDIDSCYVLDTSDVTYGPYEAKETSAHGVRYSPLHLTAEVCEGCHEFRNEYGVGVLETYTEWKNSPYPKDEIHCQNCHMPMMFDLAVADGHKDVGYYVTGHEFKGGHSRINLSNAVTVETTAKKRGRLVDVQVSVTNAESGHKLPTGLPARKLVLGVVMKTKANVEIGAARKVYRKVLIDKYGTIIEKVPDMFLRATEIYSDNRIEPKETRVENFTFEVPKWVRHYNIETRLNYEYTRPVLTEEAIKIEMARNVVNSRAIK